MANRNISLTLCFPKQWGSVLQINKEFNNVSLKIYDLLVIKL